VAVCVCCGVVCMSSCRKGEACIQCMLHRQVNNTMRVWVVCGHSGVTERDGERGCLPLWPGLGQFPVHLADCLAGCVRGLTPCGDPERTHLTWTAGWMCRAGNRVLVVFVSNTAVCLLQEHTVLGSLAPAGGVSRYCR
jgi:hypothetical protein